MYENPSQHINIPKGGDKKMDEVQRIKMEIEKAVQEKGLDAIEDFFSVEEVKTEEQRKNFNKIWQSVWVQEGFHDNSLENTIKHHGLYEDHSTDIILSVQNHPIGTMRIVWNEKNGTPALNDFTIDKGWEKRDCAEFTLLTVLPEWRGLKHLTSFALWKEGCRIIQEKNSAENKIPRWN